MSIRNLFIPFLLLSVGLVACSRDDNTAQTQVSTPTLNIYSYRNENLIKPLLDQFSQQTGVEINLITSKPDVLFERLKAEGTNTPADVLLTTDVGHLTRAKQAGFFQPVNSSTLTTAVPQSLRDPDNQWFGLSYRARVIMVNDNVAADAITSYADLADEQWRNRICMRSSSNIYNQSLMASIIAAQGEVEAQQWATGVVANFARDPSGNDRSQMTSVAVGECDVTLANTYYLGTWLAGANEQEQAYAEKLRVIMPDQAGRGTHINVSGAGVIASSDQTALATQLLEFLVSPEAQQWYAESNHEYPVNTDVEPSERVKSWGWPFEADTVALFQLGNLNAEAIQVYDRAGWR